MIKIIIVLIVLCLGLYYIAMHCRVLSVENFLHSSDKEDSEEKTILKRCPNILLERQNQFYLYNSKMASVPGINPIRFNNLEEYVDFIKWQRGQGINCPVLHLQYIRDTQDNGTYIVRRNTFDNQSQTVDLNHETIMNNIMGNPFDMNTDRPPMAMQGPFSFDPLNQYIGVKTPVDRITLPRSNNNNNNPNLNTNFNMIEVRSFTKRS